MSYGFDKHRIDMRKDRNLYSDIEMVQQNVSGIRKGYCGTFFRIFYIVSSFVIFSIPLLCKP